MKGGREGKGRGEALCVVDGLREGSDSEESVLVGSEYMCVFARE